MSPVMDDLSSEFITWAEGRVIIFCISWNTALTDRACSQYQRHQPLACEGCGRRHKRVISEELKSKFSEAGKKGGYSTARTRRGDPRKTSLIDGFGEVDAADEFPE
jgi:hypothetical protein